jgi:hypothetical protein
LYALIADAMLDIQKHYFMSETMTYRERGAEMGEDTSPSDSETINVLAEADTVQADAVSPQPKEEYRPQRARDFDIGELERPIGYLIGDLWNRFGRGEYQLIIGDDASGRIPTLIISGVAKEVSREKGVPAPKTVFFAGSRDTRWTAVDKKTNAMAGFLEEHVKNINAGETVADNNALPIERALIVTDMIDTGKSLLPLAKALEQRGIEYDIATIGTHGQIAHDWKSVADKFNGRIITGGQGVPTIYRQHLKGGVKNMGLFGDAVFAKPYIMHDFNKEGEYVAKHDIVNAAREDVTRIVGNIVHKFSA